MLAKGTSWEQNKQKIKKRESNCQYWIQYKEFLKIEKKLKWI
jgi:hypothetical protein